MRTLAGEEQQIGSDDAVGRAARFSFPVSVVVDEAPCATCTESSIYLADVDNHAIRSVGVVSARVLTLAGGVVGYQDGLVRVAKFNRPVSVALDPARRRLFVTDQGNYRVRLIVLSADDGTPAEVSTLAGSGQPGQNDGVPMQATFTSLSAICVDPKGLRLYIADSYAVRVISLSSDALKATKVETLAGSARYGMIDGQRSKFECSVWPDTRPCDGVGWLIAVRCRHLKRQNQNRAREFRRSYNLRRQRDRL